MKLIYIAGAYRNHDTNGVWENIMQACSIARKIWKLGLVAICPHTNTIFMDGDDIPPEVFLEGDLEILRRCDAIFMLSGWEKSEGAVKEWELAKELDMPVIYQEDGMTENFVALMNLKWG